MAWALDVFFPSVAKIWTISWLKRFSDCIYRFLFWISKQNFAGYFMFANRQLILFLKSLIKPWFFIWFKLFRTYRRTEKKIFWNWNLVNLIAVVLCRPWLKRTNNEANFLFFLLTHFNYFFLANSCPRGSWSPSHSLSVYFFFLVRHYLFLLGPLSLIIGQTAVLSLKTSFHSFVIFFVKSFSLWKTTLMTGFYHYWHN